MSNSIELYELGKKAFLFDWKILLPLSPELKLTVPLKGVINNGKKSRHHFIQPCSKALISYATVQKFTEDSLSYELVKIKFAWKLKAGTSPGVDVQGKLLGKIIHIVRLVVISRVISCSHPKNFIIKGQPPNFVSPYAHKDSLQYLQTNVDYSKSISSVYSSCFAFSFCAIFLHYL